MSNATDKTSCLSHRPNIRFFVMYEDFLDVAKVSEHQYKLAAFWRVLETKTNDRITYNEKLIEDAKKQGLPEPETSLWIELTYSDFVNRALGVYKSSSFQVAAAESERLGFSESRIRRRPRNPLDPESSLEEYKEYRFNTDAMQAVLNGGEMPTPIDFNSPLLNSITERKKKRAIEKNSTPIKNNRGKKKTPIENNSSPLLKSIGNKYSQEESDTEVREEEGTSREDHAATFAPAPTPAHSQDDPIATTNRQPTHEHEENEHDDMAMAHDSLDSRQHAHEHSADFRAPLPVQGGFEHAGTDRSGRRGSGEASRSNHRTETAHARTGAGQQEAPPPVATSERVAQDVPAGSSDYEKAAAKRESARAEPKQDTLIARPTAPEMPLPGARWCAETAVLVSEALRGKYYTDGQRKNQESAARRMFHDFKDISRAQFEEVFADWVTWWREHDMGLFTLAGLLARGKDHEVRLQTALDRLDARAMRPPAKKPDASKGGFVLAVNDPAYNIDDDFYNNAAALAKFGIDMEGAHV